MTEKPEQSVENPSVLSEWDGVSQTCWRFAKKNHFIFRASTFQGMRSKLCKPNPTTMLETMSIKIPNPVSFFKTIQYTPTVIKATFEHRFANLAVRSPRACWFVLPKSFPAQHPRLEGEEPTASSRGRQGVSLACFPFCSLYRNPVRDARTPK
jgi:hypothetical protein